MYEHNTKILGFRIYRKVISYKKMLQVKREIEKIHPVKKVDIGFDRRRRRYKITYLWEPSLAVSIATLHLMMNICEENFGIGSTIVVE